MKKMQFTLVLALAVSLLFSACAPKQPPSTAVNSGGKPESENQAEDQTLDSTFFYLKFRRLAAQNHLDQAEQALKQAIRMDEHSSFLKQELIRLYHQQGQSDEALALAEDLVREHPEDVDNLLILVRLKKGEENSPEFSDLLKKILRLDPQNKESYLRLGKLYMDQEAYDQATDLFQEMVANLPDDYVAHFYLGETLLATGKEKQAEQAFLKTIELEPSLVEPRFRLIEILEQQPATPKTRTQILAIFDKILEVEPGNDRAAFEKALFYYKNNDDKHADEIFAQLSDEARKNPRLVMSAVETFITPKRYADAVIVFTQLGKAIPSDSNLNFFTGMAYEGEGDIDKAIEYYLKVTPDHPQYKKTVLSIAFLYRDQGYPDKAIQFLEQHHAQSPADIDILTYLSSFYEDEGQYDKAMTLLQNGLKLSPDNTALLFKLGAVEDKAGMREDSINTMKSVLRMDPDHASALNYLGYTYAEMGIHLDEALDLIRRALTVKPDDGYITDSLGWVYYQKKEYEKAVFHLEKAAKLSDFETIIVAHLADAYVQLRQYSKALAMYRKALTNAKEDQTDEVNKIKDKIKRLESQGHAAP